jgi:hypothetical protein
MEADATSSGQSAGSSSAPFYWSVSKRTGLTCPQGGAKGRDGKCPTYQYEPATEEQVGKRVEDYADKSKAVDAARELVENNAPFPTDLPVTLTGPQKVESEPRTTTKTDAEGNTTTTTTKDVWNITYQGDSYTWNHTTVTTNSDGSSTEETDPEPDKVAPATDPDMPGLPDLYERKYPNGLAGVWNEKSGAFSQTPIFQFLAGLNPNLGNGGCPVWTFPAGQVLGITVGGDISVSCAVWSFVRVFFTLCALILARRLIFGG